MISEVNVLSFIEEKISRETRENEAKTELSEDGMAMDAAEIPHGSAEDPDETVVSPAHRDE